jgi:hypothetical protein
MTIRSGIGLGVAVAAAWTFSDAVPMSRLAAQSSPRAVAMQGYFDAALEVHAAVIRGDLVAAPARAEALATALERETPGAKSATALRAVVDAAHAVQRATDVLGAARATADLLNGCGRCHRAEQVAPAFTPMARKPADSLPARMHAHRQAVDLLLEGLMVPSDEAWRNGARELAVAPLHDPTLPVDPAIHQSLAAFEARFHRLATDAAQTTEPHARAGFYAQFLAGCADCHRRHRPIR